MKRLLGFPLVRLALIVLLFGLLAAPVALALRGMRGIWIGVATSWALAALLVVAIVIVERLGSRKPLASIGLEPRRAVREGLAGFAIGALLFSLVALELFAAGSYRVVAVHVRPDLATAALLFLGAAALEELIFRGVVFRLVEEWTGTWIALAVSAILFGLAHAANPGATPLSSAAIALEAGILLGAAYVLTRNLWLPIGLHFGWNFFEGPIFGTHISGGSFVRGAVTAHLSGPSWITGGAFGPEAGIPAVLTCLTAAAFLLGAASRRKSLIPPSWSGGRALTASA